MSESVTFTRTYAAKEDKVFVNEDATWEMWSEKIEKLPEEVRECARQYCGGVIARTRVIQR